MIFHEKQKPNLPEFFSQYFMTKKKSKKYANKTLKKLWKFYSSSFFVKIWQEHIGHGLRSPCLSALNSSSGMTLEHFRF